VARKQRKGKRGALKSRSDIDERGIPPRLNNRRKKKEYEKAG
jgi:hypothetical protein